MRNVILFSLDDLLMKELENVLYRGPVVMHEGLLSRADRNSINGHRSGVVWFTGLPAAGKSTIAYLVEQKLVTQGVRAYVLDGDKVRRRLNADLGFAREGRRENLRRIAEVVRLFVDAGIVVLAAFISPYREDRALVKNIIGAEDFIEVHVKCPAEICETRDPKGMYRRARRGEIEGFTGVQAPYEEPLAPDLVIETAEMTPGQSVDCVLTFLRATMLSSRTPAAGDVIRE